MFFEWLTSEGLIASNPIGTIKKPKVEQKVVQAFSQEEVKRLLSLCDNKTFLDIRNRAIFMLVLDTGLRLSELADLGFSDIDFERGTVLVRKGKGRKQRILHLGNRCQRALWKRLMLRESDSDALFVSKDGQPLTERGVSIWFKQLCEKAHITGGHGVHRLGHPWLSSSYGQVAML